MPDPGALGVSGQTWVITGAASGVGRSVARLAHAGGASVVAVDRDASGLAELADELDGLRTVAAVIGPGNCPRTARGRPSCEC